MSGYTGTQGELLYSVSQASTAVTTPTVSPGASMMPGLPPIQVPGGFMANATGTRASALVLKMWGLMTATATVPTWGYSLSYTSAVPAVWSGSTLLATASTAFTPIAGTAPWYMEFDISYRTANPQGSPATGVVVAMGQWTCPLFPGGAQVAAGVSAGTIWSPPAGTLGNATAWDPNVSYFLWPTLFCGAATANNFVTTEIVKLYGEN
jgi:hypothetical protein